MQIFRTSFRQLSLPGTLVFFLLVAISCNRRSSLFKELSPDRTGIRFVNQIIENDSINPLDLEFLYNGGGVGVADLNRDSLPDLFFTGNLSSCRLYLNQGDLRFRDITDASGTGGEGRWVNGVSVVDVNADGWPDLYLSATIWKDGNRRRNLLYVHQGLNSEGIPFFREMAAAYGLDDSSYSVQAVFFDYDLDGDLDMYQVNTRIAERQSAFFGNNATDDDSSDADILYRNDWDSTLGHPKFSNVSRAAGITGPGYGLGISVSDLNRDGWPDLYVTNDFFSSDVLYLNNRDGSFTNSTRASMAHTAQNAMGCDIADINNDGWMDILSVDMNPEDRHRKNTNLNARSYYLHQRMETGRIMLQYVRNTLQLHQGLAEMDTVQPPRFSEIGFFAGVAETDWSWSALFSDVDNDGLRDILITNGYPKDVTDHDFGTYRRKLKGTEQRQQILAQVPSIRVANYGFRNTGSCRFQDQTIEWGLNKPDFSTGAACADLDLDGDLDYIVSRINEPAALYENRVRQNAPGTTNYLQVRLNGGKQNPGGIGARLTLYAADLVLHAEHYPVRGYLSACYTPVHFGLGNVREFDSLVVRWPDGRVQTVKGSALNRVYEVSVPDVGPYALASFKKQSPAPWFYTSSRWSGIRYEHRAGDVADFDREKLLPHKLSQIGPPMATGDVDGNGLEDLFVGGNGDLPGKFFLQFPDGQLREQVFDLGFWPGLRRPRFSDALLFDADGDGDPDLYLASGGNEFPEGSPSYQDLFFINDGKGRFDPDTSLLPRNYTSKSVVRAADFDGDGDLDLFVAGRSVPGRYPLPASSFLYRNDSKAGRLKFADITEAVAPFLRDAGMVTDASWQDLNADGQPDLLLIGEWMAPTVLLQRNGKFQQHVSTGVDNARGWWNCISAADLDGDGDLDYVLGNLGTNSFYRAGPDRPMRIYAADFDRNGTLDPITTMYFRNGKGKYTEYPVHFRDEVIAQLPVLRKRFPTYKDYARVNAADLFTSFPGIEPLVLSMTEPRSCWLENKGKVRFELHPLPPEAQLAPIHGIDVDDFNRDGSTDILLSGNDFGNEPTHGRYDAFNGLLLRGEGGGKWKAISATESGLRIQGDARAITRLRWMGRDTIRLVAQHNGDLLCLIQRR